MAAGSSINWANISEVNQQYSSAYQQANSAYNLAGLANSNANAAYDLAMDALDEAYNNAMSDRDIFNILTSGGTRFGIFSDSTSNRLYINANYIRAGTIDADIITLGSDWGGFRCARGHDGVGYTYGSMMYGSDDSYYFMATNKGVRMQTPSHDFTITNSGLYADEEITIGSDRRIKNSISYDMEKYGKFFLNLKPSYYKLNNGKSGRFHLGFIAQDVEQAIILSGLATTDFAGLVQSSGVNDVHDEYEDQYYLRYSDFISLNTFMIQRLLSRVNALESKINSMS